MTMDSPMKSSCEAIEKADPTKDDIINFLTSNENVHFKLQQKWEPDLSRKEKSDIALEIFESSKLNFLLKFGKHLKSAHLDYFQQFIDYSEPEWEEVKVFLDGLHVDSAGKTVKNRRFEALKKMIEEESYFTENEMRKRNPLLYEQLVGRYMSEDEIKERDKYTMDQDCTFVKILMEGIEREDAESFRKKQEEDEDDQMEEEEEDQDSSSSDDEAIPSTSRWGEFEKNQVKISRKKPKIDPITEEERSVLKQEFISTMYQNFLDGKDDFDYSGIDEDASYDNLNEIDHDEEDKYFDSEEPDDGAEKGHVSSEDELDIYMNALTQHPAVQELSKDLNKL